MVSSFAIIFALILKVNVIAHAELNQPTKTKAPTIPLCTADATHDCDEKVATPKISQVCAPEIEKFCKKIKDQNGAILKCLEKHAPALTPDCKSYVENNSHTP